MADVVETPSEATLGWGTLLQRGDEDTDAGYVTVTECTKVGIPPLSRPQVDVTHFQSPGSAREYIVGLGDTTELDCECNYVSGDGTQDETTGVIYDAENRVKRYWRVCLTDADGMIQNTFTFIGTVNGYDMPLTPDAAKKLTFKIQLNTRLGWS